VNTRSQQGGFQNYNGQGQSNFQANRTQPVGYVQSHYQGGITSQNAGPVISHVGGYSANQNQTGSHYSNQNTNQSYMSNNQFNNQLSNNSQFSNNNQYAQPVIAHAGGYSANQQSYGNSMGMSSNNASQMNNQQQPVISHMSSTMSSNTYRPQQASYNNNHSYTNASTGHSPVYHATHASQQEGPVLSQLGYTAGSQSQAGSYQGQNFASAGQNSMYQSQPVISHLGYSASSQGNNNQYTQNYANNSQQASYQQQPVISHLGYTAGSQASSSQAGQHHASTGHNPVYQATQASQQEGPVLSQLGYSSSSNQAGQNNFN